MLSLRSEPTYPAFQLRHTVSKTYIYQQHIRPILAMSEEVLSTFKEPDLQSLQLICESIESVHRFNQKWTKACFEESPIDKKVDMWLSFEPRYPRYRNRLKRAVPQLQAAKLKLRVEDNLCQKIAYSLSVAQECWTAVEKYKKETNEWYCTLNAQQNQLLQRRLAEKEGKSSTTNMADPDDDADVDGEGDGVWEI